MTNTEVIISIIIVAFMSLGVLYIIWFISFIITEYFKAREKAKFKEELASAIKLNQPTWEQVLLISTTRSLSQTDVNVVVKELIRDALSGKAEGLQTHVSLLESYLQSQKREEPFEDLPEEIRVQLERIKAQIPDRPELLDSLADQLRELKARNIREKRRQSYISMRV